MSQDAYPARTALPEEVSHNTRVVGTGASAPTLERGEGITITRTSAGLYKYTWSENPGVFVGMRFGMGAATPSALAGHTLVRDTYDSSTFSIEVLLSDAAEAAHDLAANEYLDIEFVFANTSVT